MSIQRVFGRQIEIYFTDGGIVERRIAEIDSIDYNIEDIVLEHTGLGESGETVDIISNKGSLSFECKKSDAQLITFFINQVKHIRSNTSINNANSKRGTRGKAPCFEVVCRTKFSDGSMETLTFRGVYFHSYNFKANGNNSEASENFKATFIELDRDDISENIVSSLNNQVGGAMGAGLGAISMLVNGVDNNKNVETPSIVNPSITTQLRGIL